MWLFGCCLLVKAEESILELPCNLSVFLILKKQTKDQNTYPHSIKKTKKTAAKQTKPKASKTISKSLQYDKHLAELGQY